MNSREHLADDLDRLVKRSRWVGYFAWAVAIIVMIYGTPIVYTFLTDHKVPAGVAWLLSLAADAALIVGLIATPILAELDKPAGWVGTLRWVAGFITWALQTAGSWTADGGPDMVGVWSHSAGPVLLFFAVEAASSFQRTVASALTEKARQLEAVEQRDADRRAYLAELEATVAARTAELTAARTEVESLTGRLDAVTEKAAADKAEAARTAERQEAAISDLREALTDERKGRTEDREDADRRLTAAVDEATKKLKEKHREALAEKGTVSLSAYRNRSTGTPRPASTGKAELTDEDAVQMMLTAHDSPGHEWSKNGVRTLTGVGLGRAEKLIGLWLTAATEKANRKAVGE